LFTRHVFPINDEITLEKTTLTMNVPNDNQLPWAFVEGKIEKVSKSLTIHLGRGVRTIKAGDLPKPAPRPSTEGMTRITGRGTSRKKS
jgi:hypothetical protein